MRFSLWSLAQPAREKKKKSDSPARSRKGDAAAATTGGATVAAAVATAATLAAEADAFDENAAIETRHGADAPIISPKTGACPSRSIAPCGCRTERSRHHRTAQLGGSRAIFRGVSGPRARALDRLGLHDAVTIQLQKPLRRRAADLRGAARREVARASERERGGCHDSGPHDRAAAAPPALLPRTSGRARPTTRTRTAVFSSENLKKAECGAGFVARSVLYSCHGSRAAPRLSHCVVRHSSYDSPAWSSCVSGQRTEA